MVKKIDEEIRAEKLPPFLVILVQGLPHVRYINSKDSTRPVEDVIIKDLLPHVDATYRTMPMRSRRGIEEMSMGGYGALRLGFKYPELFRCANLLEDRLRRNLVRRDQPCVPETKVSYCGRS